METAGLYIHLPFCKTKCHYCAFNSRPAAGRDLPGYLAALLRQMETMAAHSWSKSHRFTSLFIGGGTPTIYDSASLCSLLERCLSLFSFSADAEITIEANPESVEVRKLRQLRATGVNRISLGVQSFDDHLLAAIGRSHSSAQAMRAICDASEAGFTNVNLDLIFGLPGQRVDMHEKSMEIAISLGVSHLAVYELMVEADSRLQALLQEQQLSLPDERVTVAMMKRTSALLKTAGLKRYEISNYSRPGFQCRHNLNYWRNGSYLGLGAGAVSCFSGLRLMTSADPELYAKAINEHGCAYIEGEALSEAAGLRETVIMGLRMIEGVDLASLLQAYPAELLPDYMKIIDRLCGEGMLVRRGGRLRLSARGLMLANRVLAELV